jgi:Holliday junction DNA helicase RuvA
MIGRLTGKLVEKRAPDLLIDVGGVGYELQAPLSTIEQLPEEGGAVCLYTHLVVREDAQLLYAFSDRRGRELFRSLIRVNGVGPKLALTILSGMNVAEFVTCVHDADTAALVKLPGVGRKTADRLLVEMRDRLQGWGSADAVSTPSGAVSGAGDKAAQRMLKQDAESALLALGYKPAEASRAIALVYTDAVDSSELLIRLALRAMAS